MIDKKEYEKAIEEFEIVDAAYSSLQSYIENGEFMREILGHSLGNVETAKDMWSQMWNKLRSLKEDRNARLKVAKDSLRQAVVLGPSFERGPDGRATVVKCGNFTVSSVTNRGFDAQTLIRLCDKYGIMEELQALTYPDKNGVDAKAFKQTYEINYEKVAEWLRAKNMTNILEVAYAEMEKTPAVKGPKEVASLGEKKGD